MMDSFIKGFEYLQIQLEEIKLATNNFDDKNCIGRGGFGKVYKGALARYKERSLVAFKRLDRKYGQGDGQFWKEIMFLSRYTHKNVISLLGFCIQEKEMILVYEHASRGSLDRYLSCADLSWKQRLKICLDAAKGLNHLHDPKKTHQRLIHCDIKSANILLDEQWNAKVADFGLSKVAPANQQNSILVTDALGTPGYCDPLFIKTYKLTKESDVYSFGVVLFEVLCGRPCYECNSNGQLIKVFVSVWKKSYKEKKLDEIIFKDLKQQMDGTSLERFSEIAFQCLKKSREERPSMSLVVETLKTALKFQKIHELKEKEEEAIRKLPDGYKCQEMIIKYQEMVNAAVHPLVYKSLEELKELFSKGFLVNGGKTWCSLNDNGEHCELISIEECLDTYKLKDDSYQYSLKYNSRFAVGTYNTGRRSFKTCVRPQFLLPFITYTVNLIFKCPRMFGKKAGKQQYISLTYKLNKGEKKNSIVYLSDKINDDWLVARLYQFTTSHQSIVDLEIEFDSHEYCTSLEIEGIEFQPVPLKINVKVEADDELEFEEKYQEIVKSAEPRLIYRSVQELKMLLSKGVTLNGGNTWFFLNDNGQHCEMISIRECLIPDAGKSYRCDHHYNSRFQVGTYYAYICEFKIRVRPQFLSPDITYTVNLVFKFEDEPLLLPEQPNIGLKYKLDGETKTLKSYLAEKREDDWWMLELCQFTSKGTTADIKVVFEGNGPRVVVEGIEFLPLELEKEEHHELEDENVDDTQPSLSHSDSDLHTYWEQKLPIDYEDIIKLSKHSLQWATKKELYFIFSKGFLLSNGLFKGFLLNDALSKWFATNNGQEWFSLDKNGKKCLMQSLRKACVNDVHYSEWLYIPESRFGEALIVRFSGFKIVSKIKSQVLANRTTYATYLVYKLPEDRSQFEAPFEVIDESDDIRKADFHYVFLVSPQTPVVIAGKVDKKTRNPLNRPKIKCIPQKRSDGWMEVQVWEFQTATTNEIIPMCLHLKTSINKLFVGLIIEGVEFRPI